MVGKIAKVNLKLKVHKKHATFLVHLDYKGQYLLG
jgi:hypothetical protein